MDKKNNMYLSVLGDQKKRLGERKYSNYYWEFFNIGKRYKFSDPVSTRIQNNKSFTTHVIVKLENITDKENILKVAMEKKTNFKENTTWLETSISSNGNPMNIELLQCIQGK
jgi:hypothetical protein